MASAASTHAGTGLAGTGLAGTGLAGAPADAMLRAAAAMSDDAIFACDPAAGVRNWSAVAERLFGRKAEEVLGAPLEGLFVPHMRRDVQAAIAMVLAGNPVWHLETEVQCPDGMPVPVSLSLSPVLDKHDHLAAVMVVARDITEQRLAQAALAEMEARLEAGEALAHVGSWLWDVRTGAVQWSAEFYRIHGVDPSEFEGTLASYLGLVDSDDRARLEAALVGSVASGRSMEEAYRVARPAGHDRVVQVRAHPTLGSEGKVVGLRGIGRDVTGTSNSGLAHQAPHMGDEVGGLG